MHESSQDMIFYRAPQSEAAYFAAASDEVSRWKFTHPCLYFVVKPETVGAMGDVRGNIKG